MSKELKKVAVILIDLQTSFVSGSWKSKFMVSDVKQLEQSFLNCKKLLERLPSEVPVLLSQCPFHNPADREFHQSVKGIIKDRGYPVVYKYDTNIMDADGIKGWMDSVLHKEVSTFVIGGCTITSCVRVSSTNLRRHYNSDSLEFFVDLSLCGARDDNYIKRCKVCMDEYMIGNSSMCGDCDKKGTFLKSPVDLAVETMEANGVKVVQNFAWPAF